MRKSDITLFLLPPRSVCVCVNARGHVGGPLTYLAQHALPPGGTVTGVWADTLPSVQTPLKTGGWEDNTVNTCLVFKISKLALHSVIVYCLSMGSYFHEIIISKLTIKNMY